MVILVPVTFQDGTIPEEVAWVMVVLLPKVKGRYQGIFLEGFFW